MFVRLYKLKHIVMEKTNNKLNARINETSFKKNSLKMTEGSKRIILSRTLLKKLLMLC